MVYLITGLSVLAAVSVHRLIVAFIYWRIREKRQAGLAPGHQMASVMLLISTHCIEVVIFALGIESIVALNLGAIAGSASGSFADTLYLSFSVYSSLGFGDVTPIGGLRVFTGVEVIAGLLLIAWSATVLFSEIFLPASSYEVTDTQAHVRR